MEVNWNNVISDNRNDIVFEGRNREYGAYQIRRDYTRVVTFIIIGMIAFSFAVFAIKLILDNRGNDLALTDAKLDMTQIDLTPPVDESEPPPPPPPPPPPVLETVKFVPPVIKDDAVEDEPPPPQEKIAETNVGQETQQGNGDDNVVVPTETGNGPVEEKAPEIFTIVEEMPEFPGGQLALMKFLQGNIQYPQVEKEAGIQGKCYIKFVVEQDGSIGAVEIQKGVSGGAALDKEAIRVVKSMPKWKAGKNNGKAARVWFNLPITFRLN